MSYQFAFVDSTGTVIGSTAVYAVDGTSDGWLQAMHEYTAPANATGIRLQLASNDGSSSTSATGSICVDDISVLVVSPTDLGTGVNQWPNSDLETDLDSNGVPDGWNRGGTDTSFDVWSTTTHVSGTHSLCVIDTSSSTYGDWFTAPLSVVEPGDTYELRWQQSYAVTSGTLHYETYFFDELGNQVGNAIDNPLTGSSSGWTPAVKILLIPAGATRLAIHITSGVPDQGTACLDDISLVKGPQQDPAAGTNLVPNPLIDLDSNNDGTPDFWSRGGLAQYQSQAVWSSSDYYTAPRSLCIERSDPTNNAVGLWQSAPIPVTATATYLLSYWEHFANIPQPPPPTAPGYDLWVAAEFLNSSGSVVGTASVIGVSGSSTGWEKTRRYLVAPVGAASLQLVMGSDPTATGSLCIDDLYLSTPVAGARPYATQFEGAPTNLSIPDWGSITTSYATLAFSGQNVGTYNGVNYGPLLRSYTAGTGTTPSSCAPNGVGNDPYTGPAFSIESYVGETTLRCEATTDLGALLGATLAGKDMGSYTYNGAATDFISEIANYYSTISTPSGTRGLIDQSVSTSGSCVDAFTGPYPAVLWAQLLDHYPAEKYNALRTDFLNAADTWQQAEPTMHAANWNFWCYDFATGSALSYGQANPDWQQQHPGQPVPVINQPEIAIGVAWIEYQAWLMTNNASYLTTAEQAMSDMATRPATESAIYDIVGWLAPLLAEKLDAADNSLHLPVEKFMNWVFNDGVSGSAAGVGMIADDWGGHDASGMIGSVSGFGGDAFVLESNTAIADVAPTARYAPQEAQDIGAWLLRVANNEYQAYPAGMPSTNQSEPTFPSSTGISSIPYECIRHFYNGQAPFATSDAPYDGPQASGWLDYTPYSAWSSALLAKLAVTTNVSGVLQADLLATDTNYGAADPTYLYYNPGTGTASINVAVGSSATDVYDEVTHQFVAHNVTGTVAVSIGADQAEVLVLVPSGGAITVSGSQLKVAGVVVDFAYP